MTSKPIAAGTDGSAASLRAAERAGRTAPGLLIDTDPLGGQPAQAVTGSGSGALMLGSRGAGAFTAMVLGSVSRYAASHASRPVVVIRDEAQGPHGLVGVGVGRHARHPACRDRARSGTPC